MTRQSTDLEAQRERLENGLAALAGAQTRLKLVALRVRQARDRSGLTDLLQPALDELEVVGKKVLSAQNALADVWTREWNK